MLGLAAEPPEGSTRPRTWSTTSAPASEQFSVWREIVAQASVPVSLARPDEGPFDSMVIARRVGPLGVSEIVSRPQRVTRTAEQARLTPGDVLFVNLPLSPGASAAQAGRVAHLRPGDFVIVDAAQPFELSFGRPFRQISLTLPHDCLWPRLAAPWQATAVRVPGDMGVGAVASGAIQALAATEGPFDRHGARALSDQVASLVALALAGLQAPVSSASRALLLQAALDEIEGSLGDPELSPAIVAERISVSTRYLHRLFADRGETFGRRLLARRLARCHEDLEDPLLRPLTIAAVACRNGFRDPDYLARAFRRRYGITPSEHRRRSFPPPAPPRR